MSMLLQRQSIYHWTCLGWLTGPIFGKELRVSSRRRRNYVLRSVYLLLLLVFIAIVWCNLDLSARSPAAMRYRMAQAGRQVISMIVLFQFVALPLMAVAMLSTAISDEVSHRTLGGLMTTPITSVQIVLGKLLSRVFQLMLMAGISLPILAFLRMFGGVPWLFILSSLCVTVTTVLFSGALSLFFSIRGRQTHEVILRTLSVLILFFGILPAIFTLMFQFSAYGFTGPGLSQTVLLLFGRFFTLTSPLLQMSSLVTGVSNPGSMNNQVMVAGLGSLGRLGKSLAMTGWAGWVTHCLIMLGLCAALVAWSVRRVRRVALSQAVGQLAGNRKGRWRLWKPLAQPVETRAIRRVSGACVVWKELRSPLVQGGKKAVWIGFGTAALVQAGMYIFYGFSGLLREDFTHVSCVSLFLVIGLLGSIFLSATTITSEKETRSWPILLSTLLDDRQILLGKAIGTFRRCLPAWLFLGAHLLLFCTLGYMHPASLLFMSLIVFWVIAFLSGTGLYFGTRFHKTSGAVISNLALILLIWLALPAVIGVLGLFGPYQALLNKVAFANPVVQAMIALTGLSGTENAQLNWTQIRFHRMHGIWDLPWAFAGMLCLYAGVYIMVGVGFLRLAQRSMRKRIFSE